MFITESVPADQRLLLRQSMLFLLQLGQISCHPVSQMLLFLVAVNLQEANDLYVTGAAAC